MTKTADDLRYPIGRFQAVMPVTSELRAASIEAIGSAPPRFREAVAGLNDEQLDTPYRPDGWTVRQVVHHLADSHLNAFVRLKLALTEEIPTIRPYDENAWARLPDAGFAVGPSLDLLEALHARWAGLYRSLSASDFGRAFLHPELGAQLTVDWQLQQYTWHSHHHLAHVTELRRRRGW
jgi:hypothetical protein